MAYIQQLDSHVADLIAAGEVVERPASVVKELVENAIDAHSSAIVVETRGGGMSLIRVTDNGCGIAPEELPTAFLRHATSKLRCERDLGTIGTLGFRGEALAAISAVSRLDILTCRTGASTGASLHLEGGVPGAVEEAGAPEGTTVRVCDLFYNTPARLKFMKKDSAETAAVSGLMQHLALSHPDVSFKYIKDGAEALHTPGDGRADSAVYAALGREFARSLVEVKGSGGEVSVGGFATKPLCGRGSRGMQIFFVNGRFIKSQLLTAALEEGYRNRLMKGRFPGCVLSVTVPVTAVDVNVHPAKTAVKFAREHDVFDAVYHAVLAALDADGAPAPTPNPPGQEFFRSVDARTFRETAAPPEKTPEPPAKSPLMQTGWNTEWRSGARVADGGSARPPYAPARPAARPGPAEVPARPAARPGPAEVPAIPASAAASASVVTRPAEEKPAPQQTLELPEQQSIAPAGETPWRIAGEVLRTYIICETETETVWLIDKHAAHERIQFDRLQAANVPPVSQQLLTPIAAELSREDGALLLENLEILDQFGFACEDFGDGAVLVRAVPAEMDAADTVSTLEEFAEALRTGRSPAERREALLHTMACKSAIKAGMRSDPRELRVLVDRVQAGEIKFCPHGRPVAVKLTKYELEKMFKRA